MINEILLRITDPNYYRLQQDIADTLKSDYSIKQIDDTELPSKFISVFSTYDQVISISNEIQFPKNSFSTNSHFLLSRIFNTDGLHVGWRAPQISSGMIALTDKIEPFMKPFTKNVCVIDTDIASGASRAFAMSLFPGCDFFAPIQLSPGQDLVDIEDLLFPKSWVYENELLTPVSYLLNPEFFTRRTSIEAKYFDALKTRAQLFLQSNNLTKLGLIGNLG